jgi:hypothetical protein
MAREPYRSRMMEYLTSGSLEQQREKLIRFIIEEAGSSHSDVIAAEHAKDIWFDVHLKNKPITLELTPREALELPQYAGVPNQYKRGTNIVYETKLNLWHKFQEARRQAQWQIENSKK